MSPLELRSRTADNVSRRITVYNLNWPRHNVMDIEYDGRSRKRARWCLWLSIFYFETFYRAVVKHRAADTLTLLPTTGKDESPIEDYVTVSMNLEVQRDRQKTGTNANNWHGSHDNEGLIAVKQAMPEFLQASDGTVKERPPTTREIVTK